MEYLLCDTPSCSETILLFCNKLFRLWLKSEDDGLQHDFAWMADKADCSVVLFCFCFFAFFFLHSCLSLGE